MLHEENSQQSVQFQRLISDLGNNSLSNFICAFIARKKSTSNYGTHLLAHTFISLSVSSRESSDGQHGYFVCLNFEWEDSRAFYDPPAAQAESLRDACAGGRFRDRKYPHYQRILPINNASQFLVKSDVRSTRALFLSPSLDIYFYIVTRWSSFVIKLSAAIYKLSWSIYYTWYNIYCRQLISRYRKVLAIVIYLHSCHLLVTAVANKLQ